MRFHPLVLLGFATLEVLLFEAPEGMQLGVTVVEYSFVLIVLLVDHRVGLLYFLSFTLLAMGGWSYILPDAIPSNFWGVRLFGVSVNALATAVIFVAVCLGGSGRSRNFTSGLPMMFLTGFSLYALLVGLIRVLFDANYFDNFVRDAAVYFSFFLYAALLSGLSRQSLEKLVRYGVSITVFSMLLSYVTGTMFLYSVNHPFVLMNGFSFIALFFVFLSRDLYSTGVYIVQVGIVLGLLAVGAVFVGAKTIIILGVAFVWRLTRSRLAIVGGVSLLMLTMYLGDQWVEQLGQFLSTETLLAYKSSQVVDLFSSGSLDVLTNTTSSAGNIVAEARTLLSVFVDQPLLLIFGKGFGGGVPDVYGVLSPLAGNWGYAAQDAVRGEFVRLHLPVFEVALKAGLAGAAAYTAVLFKLLRSPSLHSFTSFVLLATVFTNSKEMMLLSLIFIAIIPDGSPAGSGQPHRDSENAMTAPVGGESSE